MVVPFCHQHRVTYAECTVGNHVYHSRYLDLLEAARGEFLRSLGPTVFELQNADFIFPVIEARLNYRFPARYDDLLAMEVWVTAIEKVRLNFGHRILNQNGKLILEAETFHACTGVYEKPKRLPEELAAKLKPYLDATPKANLQRAIGLNQVQESILYYLIERERDGQTTKGINFLFPKEVEALAESGFVHLEQSHAVSSLQNSVMVTTIIHLTDKGRKYFER
jgi:acyl-CoA thioester hydrolase